MSQASAHQHMTATNKRCLLSSLIGGHAPPPQPPPAPSAAKRAATRTLLRPRCRPLQPQSARARRWSRPEGSALRRSRRTGKRAGRPAAHGCPARGCRARCPRCATRLQRTRKRRCCGKTQIWVSNRVSAAYEALAAQMQKSLCDKNTVPRAGDDAPAVRKERRCEESAAE